MFPKGVYHSSVLTLNIGAPGEAWKHLKKILKIHMIALNIFELKKTNISLPGAAYQSLLGDPKAFPWPDEISNPFNEFWVPSQLGMSRKPYPSQMPQPPKLAPFGCQGAVAQLWFLSGCPSSSAAAANRSSACWWLRTDKGNRTMSSAKSRHTILRFEQDRKT